MKPTPSATNTSPASMGRQPGLAGLWGRTGRGLLALLVGAAALVGCDLQHIAELEEGVSTEADVRQRFGEPEAVWDEPNGVRVFEYNRQPAGYQNYMISIAPDGKMAALRQVLNTANLATIQPGMPMETVRRKLGKPKAISQWPAKGEVHYDWRFQDGPNGSDAKIFTAVFSPDLRVMRTETVTDPDLTYQSAR
jgi:hypothetical protein